MWSCGDPVSPSVVFLLSTAMLCCQLSVYYMRRICADSYQYAASGDTLSTAVSVLREATFC